MMTVKQFQDFLFKVIAILRQSLNNEECKIVLVYELCKAFLRDNDKYADLEEPNITLPEATQQSFYYHFNTISFALHNFDFPNPLGLAYEYILRQLSLNHAKQYGEFHTPPAVSELMVRLLRVQDGDVIYDPTVGAGNFFISATKYAKSLTFYGQELSPLAYIVCRVNMALHNAEAYIEQGDILTNPAFLNRTFNKILANPPFSQNYNKKDLVALERFPYGFAPEDDRKGDFMFLQHIIYMLNSFGMAAVVVPNGILFRPQSEKTIRKNIVEADLIEAIIELPENLFYNTSIPTSIIIINKKKTEYMKDKVLFIKAPAQYEEAINSIVSVFSTKTEREHFSRLVSLEEIRANDYVLMARYYIPPPRKSYPLTALDILNKLSSQGNQKAMRVLELYNSLSLAQWDKALLGNFIIGSKRSRLLAKDGKDEGLYPYFTAGEKILRYDKWLVDGENIFITRGGRHFRVYYLDGKAAYSDHIYSFKVSGIEAKYLYYYLLKERDLISDKYFMGTSGLKHLRPELLKATFMVYYPDRVSQKRIVEMLDLANEILEPDVFFGFLFNVFPNGTG